MMHVKLDGLFFFAAFVLGFILGLLAHVSLALAWIVIGLGITVLLVTTVF